MKQISSIQRIDTGILYALELTSSISVLLLGCGLIASMVNVLTKGTLLTGNGFMQSLYAWSQCISQTKVREVAQALSMSPSTASKWMRQVEGSVNDDISFSDASKANGATTVAEKF